MRQWISPLVATERVPLREALGRVLASPIDSPLAVPAHDNSAMDGFAFSSAALQAASAASTSSVPELELAVVGRALAGHPWRGDVGSMQCVRITTGAWLPDACDTVIPHEQVEQTPHAIRFSAAAVRGGANCRRAGEDLQAGQIALTAGRIVRAADLGLLASLGISTVNVRRRLRVAFFSTGDELRSPGEPLDPGCVYDSNRHTLFALLQRMNCDTLDLGIVRDEPAALDAALRTAVAHADVVLTSGGVSAGEADFTQTLLQTRGEIAFRGLALRPGRPLTFGRIHPDKPAESPADGQLDTTRATLFFGLPGNPVAVMVTFALIVRDALLALAGAQPQPVTLLGARSRVLLRKRAGRTEYPRGIASRGSDGQWQVAPTGSQSSGALNTMSEANCFIVLSHEQTDVSPGEMVDIMLFDGLF